MNEKAKILIVDDEREFTELMETILNSEGFNVAKAFDGPEALSLIKEESPDIVLLDIGMPVIDGFKVCEMLRREPTNAKLPILMLTGLNTESDIVQALQAGADDYIAKPFETSELLVKVKKLLGEARLGKLPSSYHPRTDWE
jgi:DNA-binding response OmpR family regulator